MSEDAVPLTVVSVSEDIVFELSLLLPHPPRRIRPKIKKTALELKNFYSKNEVEVYKKYEIEISGGLSLEDLIKIKSLDVDRISVGKITHSASSFDISLDVKI